MAVIGQSHLLWVNRVPDHSNHSNTIVIIVPTEVGLICLSSMIHRLVRNSPRGPNN